MKSGKVIKGKLAETFIRLGIASETSTGKSAKKDSVTDKPNTEEAPKRKRRTKAEIEAEKKNESI